MGEAVRKLNLSDLVLKAHRELEGAQSACVKAGVTLLELRARIEAGEGGGDWWAYYEKHFARSRRVAERCMQLAQQENPEKAYDAAKAQDRDRKQSSGKTYGSISGGTRHRDGIPSQNSSTKSTPRPSLRVVQPEPEQEPDDRAEQETLVQQALELVKLMRREYRLKFVVQLRKIYRD